MKETVETIQARHKRQYKALLLVLLVSALVVNMVGVLAKDAFAFVVSVFMFAAYYFLK